MYAGDGPLRDLKTNSRILKRTGGQCSFAGVICCLGRVLCVQLHFVPVAVGKEKRSHHEVQDFSNLNERL